MTDTDDDHTELVYRERQEHDTSTNGDGASASTSTPALRLSLGQLFAEGFKRIHGDAPDLSSRPLDDTQKQEQAKDDITLTPAVSATPTPTPVTSDILRFLLSGLEDHEAVTTTNGLIRCACGYNTEENSADDWTDWIQHIQTTLDSRSAELITSSDERWYGAAPTQLSGRTTPDNSDSPFFFRARGGAWTLRVGDPADPTPYDEWMSRGDILAAGDDPTDGSMSFEDVDRIITYYLGSGWTRHQENETTR